MGPFVWFRDNSKNIIVWGECFCNRKGKSLKTSYLYKSPIGVLKICEKGGSISNVYLEQDCSSVISLQNTTRHSDLLYEAYRQLEGYFRGKRKRFDLPLHYEGTPFQQQVWSELQNIPYGETRCYEDIAIGIGNMKAVRAVGQANHKNPIMIFVPCHRVINKNGTIGGFGGGIGVKQYLLDLERANQ